MTASTSTCSTGCPARWTSICASVAFEQEPARTASGAVDPLEGAALAGREALADEVPRQPERDAGAAGEERRLGAGIADRQQVVVRDRVDDDEPFAARGGAVERLAERRPAAAHHGPRHKPDRLFRLAGEPAPQVRVGHRVEGMVLEPGFVEEPVADEEMALVDGAAGGRERRTGGDAADPERARQRLADRADIALRRRIEGRAVLEHELPAPLRPQPLEAPRSRARPRRPPRSSGSSARRRRPRRSRAPASSAGRGTARSRARPWRACWRCRSRR